MGLASMPPIPPAGWLIGAKNLMKIPHGSAVTARFAHEK